MIGPDALLVSLPGDSVKAGKQDELSKSAERQISEAPWLIYFIFAGSHYEANGL